MKPEEGSNNDKETTSATVATLISETQSVISAAQEEQWDYKPLIPIEDDPSWERIRNHLFSTLPELDPSHLALLRNTYIAGIRDREVLNSLACLGLYDNSTTISSSSEEPRQPQPVSNYDQHAITLAQCLALPSRRLRKSAKLACVRALMTLLTPLEAGWQLQDRVIRDTLRFMTDRSYVWEYLDHSHELLLWELRAMCLHEIEIRQDQISEKIAKGGDVAAELINKSAKCMEWGLEQSTNVVTTGIEGAGDKLKILLKPEDIPLLEANLRAKVVALAYTEYAKRATVGARETSHQAITRIKDSSAKGIHNLAIRLQDQKLGQRFIPHEQSREIITAAGRVGVAAVGGAAVVADSLVKSTGSVAKTTAAVTADLVHHKYGASAGTVVRNSSDTIGNVFRTVGYVTLMHRSRSMANSVTKQTGKMHLAQLNDKNLMDESESSEEDHYEEVKETVDNDHEQKLDEDDSEEIASEEQLYEELPQPDSNRTLVLREETMRQFDTAMSISPEELDYVLPDEISTNDAQSDFFSDITNDLLAYYEGDEDNCYSHFCQEGSSRSGVFRDMEDSFLSQHSSAVQKDAYFEQNYPIKKKQVQSCDNSLEYTACTVEESFITNDDSLLEEQGVQERMSAIMLSEEAPFDIQADMYHDEQSTMNHNEPLSTQQQNIKSSESIPTRSLDFNRIPPNGYVTTAAAPVSRGNLADWPKGVYSSIKSRFKLH